MEPESKATNELNNTSHVQHMDFNETSTVPSGISSQQEPAVRGWNWGAFFLTFVWGIFNKSYLTFLIFIPALLSFMLSFADLFVGGSWLTYVGYAINSLVLIWFGKKGNDWAWKNRRFKDVEQFKSVQKKWAIAGWIVFAVIFLLSISSSISLNSNIDDAGTTKNTDLKIDNNTDSGADCLEGVSIFVNGEDQCQ